jgi:hypothetical protein
MMAHDSEQPKRRVAPGQAKARSGAVRICRLQRPAWSTEPRLAASFSRARGGLYLTPPFSRAKNRPLMDNERR